MSPITIHPVPASEPGALPGFAWSCDRGTCGRFEFVGSSSLESLARQGAAEHARWHDGRGDA